MHFYFVEEAVVVSVCRIPNLVHTDVDLLLKVRHHQGHYFLVLQTEILVDGGLRVHLKPTPFVPSVKWALLVRGNLPFWLLFPKCDCSAEAGCLLLSWHCFLIEPVHARWRTIRSLVSQLLYLVEGSAAGWEQIVAT